MEYLFISTQKSFKELLKDAQTLRTAGYDPDKVHIANDINTFAQQIPQNSTIIVPSLDFFPSLIEMLTTLSVLQKREIVIKSINEPWLNQQITSNADFLDKLRELAITLHQNRTQKGLQKARDAGKQLGRPVGSRKTR